MVEGPHHRVMTSFDDARFYADLAREEIAALAKRVEVLERLLADVMRLSTATAGPN
jgi:hypothetical protein